MEDMYDYQHYDKKRSLSFDEDEEALNQHTPMLNPPKKPRLHDGLLRPAGLSVDMAQQYEVKSPHMPKNKVIGSAPVKPSPMRSSTSSKVQPHGESKFLDKHVRSYIKSELGHREGSFIPGYPVIDFVRNVWGFSPERIPQGKTGYSIDSQLIYAYETSEYSKGKQYKSNERNSCKAFQDIFNKLVELVKLNQKETRSHPSSSRLNGKLFFLRECILKGDYASFKPDYALAQKGTSENRKKKLHWHRPGMIVGEQKKHVPKAMEDVPLQGKVIIDPGLLLSKEGSTSVENDTSQSHQWGKGKEREEQHSEEKVAISDADRMHTAEAENPMLEAGEPGRLRDEEIQITKYLNELLSHGIRQYSSGFLVEDQCISLWYADRYGVIKSVNFNWVKEPHYLLLVVAALLFADRQRLGFSPFVELDPKAPEKNPFAKATLRVPVAEELDGTQINQEKAEGGAGHESEGDEEGEGDKECHIREGDERAEDQSQRIGERMNIHRMKNTDGKSERNEELAKTKSCTLDSDGKEIAITLEFSFDASSGRRIVTNYGIIGRGTTVIPVKVAGNQVTSKALRMEGDASLVAKLAWQHVDRKEDALIRTIRQALNAETDTEARSMLNHVVDMKCSLSLSMDSPCINLPRIFMSRLRPLPRQDLREFRLLILESYEPLANITKVNDFKKVFIETFKAHHWVWTKAEVLHRDISINNIMFRRRDGTVEGVLCDWDLAATKSYMGEPMDYSHVDADEIAARIAAISNGPSDSDEDDVDWADMASHDINVLVQNHAVQSPGQTRAPAQSLANTNGPSDSTGRSWKRPRYRTGTGPFMSLELLQSPPDKAPVHRYSFDVQSFFYVFIWVCATHNPQKKEMGNIPQWMHKTLDETYNAKAAYWTSARVREEVINQAHPAYRRLTNTWYRKLLPMFSKAAMTFFAITDLRAELIDALVEDDMERVHDLRAQIKLKAKELEETITYEGFLAALK